MPTPRMPSQSQIRSQMRAVQRKAKQQINTEVRKTGQKVERELKAAQRKGESEAKAQQHRNEQAAQREIDKWVRDTNRKLQSASRPTVTYRAAEERTLGAVATEAEQQAQRTRSVATFSCATPGRTGREPRRNSTTSWSTSA